VPISWSGDIESGDLPRGWSDVVAIAALDSILRRKPRVVSALEITIKSDFRGMGLSYAILRELISNAGRLGYKNLIAPVRPTMKQRYPNTAMSDYLQMRGPDGLSLDPWIRVHQRLGGRIVASAPLSMTIAGTLEEWRAWTSSPFDRSGLVSVAGALAPVMCDTQNGSAVYVEPNVWVLHPT
jgi:hypothetical protein